MASVGACTAAVDPMAGGMTSGSSGSSNSNSSSATSSKQETVARAKELFKKFDTSGSGTLDMDDLIKGFEALGVKEARKQAMTVMRKADVDGDYSLDFYEFMYYVEQEGQSFFDIIDGGSGSASSSSQNSAEREERNRRLTNSMTASIRRKKSSRPSINNNTNNDDDDNTPTTSDGATILKRFKQVRKLGEGGFGVTFVAEDRDCLNKLVVCKYLHNTDPDALRLFRLEAKKLMQLSHPNIPNISAYYEIPDEDKYLLVMEYIDGHDLNDLVRKQGPLKCDAVMSILRDLFGVLVYVHSQGIVHRDIKPPNIMKAKDGKIYLLDFGACAAVQTKGGFASTIIGTPGYVPPEVSMGCASYESDFYSLGASALFLLTGESPHSMMRPSQENMFAAKIARLKSSGVADASMASLLEAMLQVNPAIRRSKIEEHSSGVLPSNNGGGDGVGGDEEANLEALKRAVKEPNFVEKAADVRSSDTQDVAAKGFIEAGDVTPSIVDCKEKPCTIKFNYLHIHPEFIKTLQKVLCQRLIDDLNKKFAALTGSKLNINLEAVVKDAYRWFLIGAHRYAHTTPCPDRNTMDQMRFALLYMACHKSMAEVREKAAEMTAQALLRRSSSGPEALKQAMQSDDFLDDVKSARSTDEQDRDAATYCKHGDCRPNVHDCRSNDCTAKFNFIHITPDVSRAFIQIIVQSMIKDLDDKIFPITGRRNALGINTQAVVADAYATFIRGIHRYTHTDAPYNIRVLHQMRIAFYLAASNQSMQKVREAAIRMLERAGGRRPSTSTKKKDCVIS